MFLSLRRFYKFVFDHKLLRTVSILCFWYYVTLQCWMYEVSFRSPCACSAIICLQIYGGMRETKTILLFQWACKQMAPEDLPENLNKTSSCGQTSKIMLFVCFRSYCERIFRDCRLQTCYVQSPAYPGVYPRNLHCRYYLNTRLPFIKLYIENEEFNIDGQRCENIMTCPMRPISSGKKHCWRFFD